MALIAPAALALALVIVFIGRQVDGRATAHTAAESAAQAAAQEREPGRAVAAAHDVAGAMLVDDTSCAEPDVAVDVSDFRPGGRVAVTVSCTAGTRGLELIDPGRRRASVTAFAVIDPLRAVEAP